MSENSEGVKIDKIVEVNTHAQLEPIKEVALAEEPVKEASAEVAAE